MAKHNIEEMVRGLKMSRARALIRQNQGKMVLVMESNGNYAYGEIDSRDAEDRGGSYTLITNPRRLMANHKYLDIEGIYLVDGACQLL